ncbi:MAG: DNA/RNA non-specific endonuclease [Chloroflexota bacterium]|nr:DNA/RNA non-specific endonuclease [Chloroflexota bacterium]MDQ5864359.1 DNA/RNA non-specific endonuclease [Chloroflexota bacterium]
MKDGSQLTGLLADEAVMEELRQKFGKPEGLLNSRGLVARRGARSITAEAFTPLMLAEDEAAGPDAGVPAFEAAFPEGPMFMEAIIRETGRPVLLVQRDTFEVPELEEWKSRLGPTKSKLEHAIRSVGRVELSDHDTFPWVGTAWMITEDVAVTNAHVARIFARREGRRYVPRFNLGGTAIRARVDFKVEYKVDAVREVDVEEVLFIAEDGDNIPDIAFLRLRTGPGIQLPPPLVLSSLDSAEERVVAAIGYPMEDSRSRATLRRNVFGEIYNVKRLAPGRVMTFGSSYYFTHDCSTLGGNSGSVIIDVETGEALGLHFGGTELSANYAVKASVLLETLAARKIKVTQPTPPPPSPDVLQEGPAPAVEDYADREGYNPAFLRTSSSSKKQIVPLPVLRDDLLQKAARVKNANGAAPVDGNGLSEYELKYSHFSVVMNGERKMPFFTVVNIDGRSLKRIPRSGDEWLMDPRIPKSAQAGNELYRNNDLDRGHMVRRLDPVWGDQDVAELSNNDTFHYTNATPQHKDLNQKTWNDLEDHILDNAGAHKLKVTVFTGPVFSDGDPEYRSFLLPRQFWKVVVIVKEDDRKLSATGYILSQQDLLSHLEFAFGQFRTYQVPVAQIEDLTGLDFGNLRTFDPLAKVEAAPIRLISRAEDLVF